MRNQLLRVLVGLICVLLIGYIYQRVEYYDEEVNLGWSTLAKRNAYLAAEKYLETRVHSVRSVSLLEEEKFDELGTIIVPDANFLQLPSTHAKIMQWVNDGGHLLIGAGYAEEPPLIKDFGFEVKQRDFVFVDETEDSENGDDEEDKPSFAEELRKQNELIKEEFNRKNTSEDSDDAEYICMATFEECNATKAPNVDAEEITYLTFEGIDHDSAIYFSSRQKLLHPLYAEDGENAEDVLAYDASVYDGLELFYWQGHQDGITFAQLNYGDGLISVAADLDILSNAQIAHFDHAYLLDLLVDEDNNVLILYGKHVPPLFVLLYRNFPEFIYSFLLLLLFSLIYFSRRFGKAIDLLEGPRRSRTERFSAVGQFYWRDKNGDGLVKHLREDIIKKSSVRWQGFGDWEMNVQVEHLAEHSGLTPLAVQKALQDELSFHENQFLALIKTLQKLRETL